MRSSNQLKAGLFIVISFAIALAVFFGITGSALLNGPKKTYTVLFDLVEDVNGLAKGSEVRIGGFVVGKVNAVDVVADAAGKSFVQASFSMPERYALRRDAVVGIQAPLTGSANLNITDLGHAQPATEADRLDGQTSGFAKALDGLAAVGDEAKLAIAELRPRVTGLLDDVRPRANGALDQIKVTAATADETIQQVRTKIEPAYEKYAGVADSTRGAMASLDSILGDGKGDIRKTLANLGELTGSTKDRVPAVLDKAAAAIDDVRGALAKTGAVLDEVRATATNAKEATASVRSIVTGNRGRIDEIVKSANLAADNLAAASAEIRHAPWRLLYKPSENEVANQNLYDATRQFADASRKLQDSALALRDATKDPAADPARVQALLDKLDADFGSYQKVQATLWDRVRK